MSFSTQIRNASLDIIRGFQGITYGEVLAYDEGAYTVDVEYKKFTRSSGDSGIELLNFPKALGIPIMLLGGDAASIKPDFKKGDIVVVALSASEIDTSGKATSDLSSFMSKSNAVVIGSLGSTADNPAIRITETEIVFTIGTTTFTIDASGATVEVGGITTNLATHIHPTGVGPSGPPTPNT